MMKSLTLAFALLSALSLSASTANAGVFSGLRAPQPTSVSGLICKYGIANGHCIYGPQVAFGDPGDSAKVEDPPTNVKGYSSQSFPHHNGGLSKCHSIETDSGQIIEICAAQ